MNALLCEKAEVLNQQNQLANDFSQKKKKKMAAKHPDSFSEK